MRFISLLASFLLIFSIQTFAQDISDSITVYFFLSEECKICQFYTDELNELHENYTNDQISFVGLFPNRHSTKVGIAAFKERYDIDFPLKKEFYQTKTKQFEASITPEVIIYDEKNQVKLYQGRIDESYIRVGKRKRVVKKRELREALESIHNHTFPEIRTTEAVGCYINLNN